MMRDFRHRPGCAHYVAPSDLVRVEGAVRAQFRLGENVPIQVHEMDATERGFPPRETRITFWTGNDSEHRYRVFKPVGQVTAADLPPWWMKDALILDVFPFCDCCG